MGIWGVFVPFCKFPESLNLHQNQKLKEEKSHWAPVPAWPECMFWWRLLASWTPAWLLLPFQLEAWWLGLSLSGSSQLISRFTHCLLFPSPISGRTLISDLFGLTPLEIWATMQGSALCPRHVANLCLCPRQIKTTHTRSTTCRTLATSPASAALSSLTIHTNLSGTKPTLPNSVGHPQILLGKLGAPAPSRGSRWSSTSLPDSARTPAVLSALSVP